MSKTKIVIPGIHAVREALEKGGLKIVGLLIASDSKSLRIKDIVSIAENRGIPVEGKPRRELDDVAGGVQHQGVVGLAERFEYADFSGITETALKDSKPALIVVADHITDEGNLGALIRVAAFFDAHGLVIPKDRSAKVSRFALKRSAGAYAHVPIAQVVNLGRALDSLKKKGFWIIGAGREGPESIYRFDWNRDMALILGREDRGLGHAVRKRCHQIVSIPFQGFEGSLNVSVAAGVILSEIIRSRPVKDN